MSYPEPQRRPKLEIVSITGEPTEEERSIIEASLERWVEEERASGSPSLWLRAGRSQGRRLGMYDYRDRFRTEDAWRLSLRFPAGGREYQGRSGRADSR